MNVLLDLTGVKLAVNQIENMLPYMKYFQGTLQEVNFYLDKKLKEALLAKTMIYQLLWCCLLSMNLKLSVASLSSINLKL